MLLNKTLFLLLFPVLASCNVHWCSHLDIEPKGCPRKPYDAPMQTIETGKPKIANDWGNDETEPQPIIDWPFAVEYA